MAKDGTRRGGKRPKAGAKPDALVDRIAKGNAAQVMQPPITELEGSDLSGEISNHNDNPLVIKTIDKAAVAEPDAHPLFHSDRGFQYTSRQFHSKLKKHHMKQSMSRVGHCIDNGPMEGFWGVLKRKKYCSKHKAEHPEEVRAAYQRGYDNRWRKFRKKYLETHPLCVKCLEEGRYTKAEVIDHIVPFRGDERLEYDPDNLQALCKRHHDEKTGKYDSHPEYKY